MTVRLLTAAALAAAALAAPPAHADDPAPSGRPCSFHTVSVSGGPFTGTVEAGPLAAPGSTVSVRCTVRIGAGHAGEVVLSEATEPTPDVTVMEPRVVTYTLDEFEWQDHYCTEATVGSTTWYYGDGEWTTEPVGECGDAFTWAMSSVPPELRPVVSYVLGAVFCLTPVRWDRTTCDLITPLFEMTQPVWDVVDPAVCEALVAQAPVVNGLGRPDVIAIDPASGDVSLAGGSFWDCPPYSTG